MVRSRKSPSCIASGDRVVEIVFHCARSKKMLRAAWLLAIFIVVLGSLLPSASLPMQTLDRLPISDKVEHLAMYAVLAFLPAIHERRGFIIAAGIGAVALGIGLEYAQLYSGWRDFEVGDMVADAVGVCFGLAGGIPIRSLMPAIKDKLE